MKIILLRAILTFEWEYWGSICLYIDFALLCKIDIEFHGFFPIHTDSEWICDTIVAAGELADEKERYAALEELRQRLENDTEIAIELDNLLPIVDKCANGLEKYWSNETDQLTGLLEKTNM